MNKSLELNSVRYDIMRSGMKNVLNPEETIKLILQMTKIEAESKAYYRTTKKC